MYLGVVEALDTTPFDIRLQSYDMRRQKLLKKRVIVYTKGPSIIVNIYFCMLIAYKVRPTHPPKVVCYCLYILCIYMDPYQNQSA